jgi:uncharacterized protein DUF4177
MGVFEQKELAKAKDRLAGGNFKGAFKALEIASSTADTRAEATRLMRELATRTDDGKLAKKASEFADTIERSDRDAAAGTAGTAAARQRAYDERASAESAKRYKVLTQKDRFFAGKFDPEKVETALNAYAEQGWRVVSMATASIPGGINREEIIILLTREPGAQNGG